MSVHFRYPNITGRSAAEQAAQITGYLRQLVEQLNYAQQNQSGTGQADSDIKNGSETVGSLPTEKATFLKAAYPIGAVYISTVATSPKTLFGFGTWERIQDRFLLAAGSSYGAGSTGGEAAHTLTTDEMPRHNHNSFPAYGNALASNMNNHGKLLGAVSSANWATEALNDESNKPIEYTGRSQPHNNMPPYLAVYVWQRTA